jgi:hypothetical protein
VSAASQRCLENYPELKVTPGKKNIRGPANVDWNKGKPCSTLCRSQSQTITDSTSLYRRRTLPIRAFQAISETGIGILVTDTERETGRRLCSADTSEVALFLEELAKAA